MDNEPNGQESTAQEPTAQYYRPSDGGGSSGAPEPYKSDRPIGIVIMVLSGLCGVCGMLTVAGVGMLGAAAASQAGTSNDAAAAAAVGGVAAIAAIVMLIVGGLGLAVGFGIMKSAKWGFVGGAVLYGLYAINNILSVVGGQMSAIGGLAICGAVIYYCVQRLTGKLGDKPV
jgi:hypothetical protein